MAVMAKFVFIAHNVYRHAIDQLQSCPACIEYLTALFKTASGKRILVGNILH